MSAFYCNICKEQLKNDRCYKTHIKSQKHYRRETNQTNQANQKNKCACGKIYQFKQGLHVHRKTCNYKEQTETESTETESTETLYNELKRDIQIQKEQHQKDKDELRNQLSLLLEMDTIKTIDEQSKEIVRLKKEITKYKQERISGKTLYQKRLKLTSNERELIAESQKSQCKLCDSTLPEYYHIDHIIALQFGGSNAFDNLQAICAGCHNHKTILETKNAKRIKEAIYGILYPSETT